MDAKRKPRAGGHASRGSPLTHADSIIAVVREKEAELTARILAAQHEADERVTAARAQATTIVAAAREEAERIRELVRELSSNAASLREGTLTGERLALLDRSGILDERTRSEMSAIENETAAALADLEKQAATHFEHAVRMVLEHISGNE